MGVYTFDGSSAAVNALLNPNGNAGSGVPLAGFLLGYPDSTTIATVINPATDAYSKHYALYAQDDWKVSPVADHQLRAALGVSSRLPGQEQ